MLRWMVPFLVAVVAAGAADAADRTVTRPAAQRAARNLPAGLPRPHYNYHTTVTGGAPYPAPRVYVQTPVADEGPEVLFTPDPVGGYIANLPGTPILPGSSTLPGYYAGESGEGNHAAMRLARYSSSHPAVFLRRRMESLPGAFRVRL